MEKNKILITNETKKFIENFCITNFCKCNECGEEVSPSQVASENSILYDNKKEKIIGFECWKCGAWITFPKNYK